ncbi:MAG: hypothetical protein JWM11_5883 [Planctomycetaceae bacterium]|nr:hypothetical protein [Planctomycetaceae bacterium]
MLLRSITFGLVFVVSAVAVQADPPEAKYIFPAGGRRGTVVPVRIGGCNFHDRAVFHLAGSGVKAAGEIARTDTLWFEGPVIPQPASQAKEDYPLDYANSMDIAADAALGPRWWKVSTSQGVTTSMPFVIGDLPEVVEQELPGEPAAVTVTLPTTVNGRIFPREDIDLWSFDAAAGQVVTCAVDALRLGSPLMARLELLDPQGKSMSESLALPGDDALIRFTAPVAGKYSIKIHDVSFGGLQTYVYRLTITAGPYLDHVFPLGGRRGSDVALELAGANLPDARPTVKLPTAADSVFDYRVTHSGVSSNGVALELDDLPEFVEAAAEQQATFPAILNGRIQRPGEADQWAFQAKKGEELDFDLRAARLGSPLDSMLQILGPDQKVLAENDDSGNAQSDSRVRFQVPADGVYRVRITDRLEDRGGPRFAYRLRVTTTAQPDYQLIVNSDAVTLERGKPTPLKVTVDRGPGVTEDVTLQIEGLPAGVTVTPTVVPKQQREVNLSFQATDKVKIACATLKITAKTTVNGKEIVRPVTVSSRPSDGQPAPVWLAVAMPTPFRFVGIFETKFMPRGSAYVRHYSIQRNGFAGAMEARLADNQGRHLQGVSGDAVAVSPGQSEFDFTVKLPPFMEIGRTSRTTLSVMGTVVDFDGSQHVVSYSSNAQNDQMIALVDPGRLAISLERRTLSVSRGAQGTVAFRLQRSNGLKQPVQIEALVPNGMRGVVATKISVPPTADQGQIEIKFDAQTIGPFQAPVLIRATTVDDRNLPVVADVPLELVFKE